MESETVTLDKHGRILIPGPIRKKMGWEAGQNLTLAAGTHELRILSRKQALEKIREELRKRIPPGVSLVDELIRERRDEVRREEEEYQQWKADREARGQSEPNRG
jgi:AbrB family looped-hinge helix DNA binding protein